MFILKPTLITGGMLSAIFAFGMVHTATGGHGSDGYIKPGYQKELGYDDHSGTSDFKIRYTATCSITQYSDINSNIQCTGICR